MTRAGRREGSGVPMSQRSAGPSHSPGAAPPQAGRGAHNPACFFAGPGAGYRMTTADVIRSPNPGPAGMRVLWGDPKPETWRTVSMRDPRFTQERADLGPRQAEECTPVSQVCRRMGARHPAFRPAVKWRGL